MSVKCIIVNTNHRCSNILCNHLEHHPTCSFNKQHCSNINFERTMIWEIPKEFDLYENDDPIVYMELNDYLVDRKNLYEVLLNYLEMIYK